jgi:hypothetical protein
METINENKINDILKTGKLIKTIIFVALIMTFCFLIGTVVVSNSTAIDPIINIYLLGGLVSVSIITYILILFNLFEAEYTLEIANSRQDDFINNSRTGELAEGGIIIYNHPNGEHGLVCSKTELGKAKMEDAKVICLNYENDGFSDWRLPDKDELHLIYSMLHENLIGNFEDKYFWSSSESENLQNNSWAQNFADGRQSTDNDHRKLLFLAIRDF